MKKITMQEFDSKLEADKAFAKKLKNYLGDENDPEKIGEKTMEFLSKEGYELDKSSIEELSDEDLGNVSGGANKQTWGEWAKEKAAGAYFAYRVGRFLVRSWWYSDKPEGQGLEGIKHAWN